MKTHIGSPFRFSLLVLVLARSAFSSMAAELESQARDFVGLLSKQDFAAAVSAFDVRMKAALPESKLRQTWDALQQQAGSFQKQEGVRKEKVQGYDVVLVTCRFEKTLLDAKVVFDSKKQIAGLFFQPAQAAAAASGPPPYANTNSFTERELGIGEGQWTLPATLTVPRHPARDSAIVLVHGSGPQDKDETIGPNKIFRDLAWGLATKGITVLRYDKRTKAYSTELAAIASKITLKEETIDDALAAVRTCRKTSGINAERVFVLGHSLGGFAAPRIAKADPSLAGLVILAGSTRPLPDLILEQTRYLVSLEENPSDEAKRKLAEIDSLMTKVKSLTTADASSAELLFGAGPAYWLDLKEYDALATARALKQPMLILQGARDYQVTDADFNGWKMGLASRSNVTFKLYPDLNHLFVTGSGKSKPSEYEQPGHVDAKVIDDIAEWILKQ
jgi:dienelactone hydrolase